MAFRDNQFGFGMSIPAVNSKERSRMNKQFWSCSNLPIYKQMRVIQIALGFWLLAFAAQAQSLWEHGTEPGKVSDKRGTACGDILAIIVQENNPASKDNSTQTAKQSSIDAAIK